MKESIRKIVLSHGADLCGFANIDRFDNAPYGYNPTDIYADCKSIISFAVALPRGLSKIKPRLIYGLYNSISKDETDLIAFKSAKTLEEKFHCNAVPMPSDTPYEYWDAEKLDGRGLLSMKHIAVQAGLGSIGKNSLLINERYGNMVTIGAILTNLDFPSDTPCGDLCIPGCKKCIEACPSGAIENGIVNQKLCRENTYGKTTRGFDTVDCNVCRTVCPMNRENNQT